MPSIDIPEHLVIPLAVIAAVIALSGIVSLTALGVTALHESGSVEVSPNGGIIIEGRDK